MSQITALVVLAKRQYNITTDDIEFSKHHIFNFRDNRLLTATLLYCQCSYLQLQAFRKINLKINVSDN